MMKLPRLGFAVRLLLVVLVAAAIWGSVVGPIRNKFDDRWPFINIFLSSAGSATQVLVLVIGLVTSIRRMKVTPRVFACSAWACGLMLLSRVMFSLYGAWVFSQRHFLNDLMKSSPTQLFLFKSFFSLMDLLNAVGMALLVAAVIRGTERVSDRD